MFRPDCKASRVIFRTGSKKQPPMKGSPAIGTRLLNGLELKHQSRFGLDCLNDHSIAEDLSRLLVERTSRGVEASNCTQRQRVQLDMGGHREFGRSPWSCAGRLDTQSFPLSL